MDDEAFMTESLPKIPKKRGQRTRAQAKRFYRWITPLFFLSILALLLFEAIEVNALSKLLNPGVGGLVGGALGYVFQRFIGAYSSEGVDLNVDKHEVDCTPVVWITNRTGAVIDTRLGFEVYKSIDGGRLLVEYKAIQIGKIFQVNSKDESNSIRVPIPREIREYGTQPGHFVTVSLTYVHAFTNHRGNAYAQIDAEWLSRFRAPEGENTKAIELCHS